MGVSICMKFDLTRNTLGAIPGLESAARREGAVRSSLIVWSDSPARLASASAIAAQPQTEYVVVKVPALEGTEFWVVAKDQQERFEKAVGFAKASIPLLVLKADSFKGGTVRHPLEAKDLPIALVPDVSVEAGTGFRAEPSGDTLLVGNATDDTIIAKAEDSGHLIRTQNFLEDIC